MGAEAHGDRYNIMSKDNLRQMKNREVEYFR